MKILFIDVDGVLNFHNSPRIAESCLQQAKRIAHETGAKFVLTSDWREGALFPKRCSESDVKFADTLLHHLGLPFIDVTPFLDYHLRDTEIQAWLDATDQHITNFAILDDLDFNFQSTFPEHFVKTSGFFRSGLTKENADKAIEILNKENAKQC